MEPKPTAVEKAILKARTTAATLPLDPDPINFDEVPTLEMETLPPGSVGMRPEDIKPMPVKPVQQFSLTLVPVKPEEASEEAENPSLPARYRLTIFQSDKLPDQERTVKESITVSAVDAAQIVDEFRERILDL